MIADYANKVNQITPAPALITYADKQGAPVEAFLAAGWSPRVVTRVVNNERRPALQFATATGPRWRFVDNRKPKYTSPKDYERCWYGLARAVGLAQRLGAPLVICNGEAGTVAAQWHGVPAACITGGETGTIPAALLVELQQAYSGPLLVAYDCDDTGRGAGPALAAELRAAGYTATALDLGGPDKFDLADFCKLHTGGALAALLDCPALPDVAARPVVIQRRETAAPVTSGAVNWPAENDLWWQDIVLPAVERAATVRRGKHFRCINPTHDDRHPSARISHKVDPNGIYVCTCGAHKRDDVATWAGAPDFMDWWKENRRALYPAQQQPARPAKPAMTSSAPPPNGAWWHAVPDGWRGLLLNAVYMPPSTAPLVEQINRAIIAGLVAADGFTAAELIEAGAAVGVSLPEKTLRRLLPLLAEIGFFSQLDYIDIQHQNEKNPGDGAPDTTGTPIVDPSSYEKNPGGRPQKRYALRPLADVQAALLARVTLRLVEKEHPGDGEKDTTLRPIDAPMLAAVGLGARLAEPLAVAQAPLLAAQQGKHAFAAGRVRWQLGSLAAGLESTYSTPLPAGWSDLGKAAQYRAALLQAQIVAGEDNRSRPEMRRALGVSNTTLSRVLDLAGIQQDHKPDIITPITTADKLDQQARQQQAGVYKVEAISPRGHVLDCAYDRKQPEIAQQWAAERLAAGDAVQLVGRVRCEQKIVRHGPPPAEQNRAKPEPATAPESQPRSVTTPARRPYYGPGHDPLWVQGQLVLNLKRLGWIARGAGLINPRTGETIDQDAPARVLVNAILDHQRWLLLRAQSPLAVALASPPPGWSSFTIRNGKGEMIYERKQVSA